MGHPDQRLRFLLGRALIRYQLGRLLGVDPTVPAFDQTPEGKPYLLHSQERPLHFSLSHSGQWVALGLAEDTALGVDLEHPLRNRPLLEIARQYFHPEEAEDLAQLNGDERIRSFYRLWTLKEAFFKARGTGLSEGLGKIGFSVRKASREPRIDPSLQTDSHQWHFSHWHNPVNDLDPCYLALAIPRPFVTEPQLQLTLPDVYHRQLTPIN